MGAAERFKVDGHLMKEGFNEKMRDFFEREDRNVNLKSSL